MKRLWRTPQANEAGARIETLYTKDGKPAKVGECAYRKTPTQMSIFSQEGSPASPSVLPGSEEALKMTEHSGRRCLELYESANRIGLLAKMLLASSIWNSTRCYLTWKVSATKQRRLLFQLDTTTLGGEYLLLPTPTTQDASNNGGKSQYSRHDFPLNAIVMAIPLWIPCPECENFWCTMHQIHAHDCICPAIEEMN